MARPAVARFEVTGKDAAALQRCSTAVFEWRIRDGGDGSGNGVVAAGAKGIAGGIGAAQAGDGGHLSFYVEVDDPAAYLGKAEQLGGRTVVPPTDIPQFGPTLAFFTDPEGHLIGLSRGAVQ